jgi:hypothetical protein
VSKGVQTFYNSPVISGGPVPVGRNEAGSKKGDVQMVVCEELVSSIKYQVSRIKNQESRIKKKHQVSGIWINNE